MASRTAILSVRVVSDTKQAQRGAQETAGAWEKFEKRLDKASVVAGVGGAALVALGKKSVEAASKLEQSSGAVETVFKKDAATITKFAETAWKNVGLSQSETQEMATILGSQLKNLGMPMEDIANQTMDLTKLGADLAATYGGKTSDAVGALSSLLRGERDPIEKYGVGIKQADIEAEKMALGLGGLTGAAEKQANIQATLSLLTKQTADAQGQAAREYDSVEASTQRANAAWENTLATLGTALLPTIADLAEHLANAATWVAENEKLVTNLALGMAGAAAGVLGLNAGIKTFKAGAAIFKGVTSAGSAAIGVVGRFAGGMRSAQVASSAFSGVAGTLGGKLASLVKTIAAGALNAGKWAIQTTILTAKMVAQKVAQAAIATASKVAAAAQWLWNAAVNANPMVLIITLIVAAIVLLIMNWDKVKAVAIVVWDAISAAAVWFYDNVLTPIGQFISGAFSAAWTNTKNLAVGVWSAIVGAATKLWNWIKSIGTWISTVFVAYWTVLRIAASMVWTSIKNTGASLWNWLKSIGSWIGSTFRNAWNGLRTAGVNALNAIISPVQNLIGWLQDAWSWVSKLFSKGGKLIGKVFGFEARQTVVNAPAGLAATAASAPSLPSLFSAVGTSSSTTNVTYKIEMPNYVGDRADLLEWIRAALANAKQNDDGIIYA